MRWPRTSYRRRRSRQEVFVRSAPSRKGAHRDPQVADVLEQPARDIESSFDRRVAPGEIRAQQAFALRLVISVIDTGRCKVEQALADARVLPVDQSHLAVVDDVEMMRVVMAQ